MDFSEEWKTIFPIGSVYDAPLLLSDPPSKSIIGPLFFNPKPDTLTALYNSPALSPPLLAPPPRLSLPRFLSTSTTEDSPILPSTASSVAGSLFSSQDQNFPSRLLIPNNRLEFLKCPCEENTALAFFPTGDGLDQIGFLLFSIQGKSLVAVGDGGDGVFTVKKKLGQQILRILVNPVGNFDPCSNVIGYLLVYTLYSVHWFCVKASEASERPVISYEGCKLFKTCAIVGACWSSHLPEESAVLLEDGGLFLFDLGDYSCKMNYKGSRLKVVWDDPDQCRNCKWLGCEFSWHPRILVVVRSDAVFLVDWRNGDFKVTCLAKVAMFGVYAPETKERFLAFSKVASDQFHFVLVSDTLLVLCDVRKPLNPVLQWAHGLDKPCYAHVLRLSQLRSNSMANTYKWANESGYGIILGSFWNCEFNLFCYGPSLPARKGSIASEISKIGKSMYAWGLPSDLLMSGRDCRCGNCLIREEFLKDSLPEWVDWQQKKDLVLGFGILSNDISSLLFDSSDEFGGFTLIRLMSSGKLESQRYSASWKMVGKLEAAHRVPVMSFEDNLVYLKDEEHYKFPKKYKYLKLDYLYGYSKGNLYKVLDSKMENSSKGYREYESFSSDIHEMLCRKLNTCGFTRFRTSPAIRLVFNDINLPTSVHEVALRRMWAELPVELLQLSFSSYSELVDLLLDQKKVPPEFSLVNDMSQLPPFFLRKPSSRSSRLSRKEQFNDVLVGPALPLPFLMTVHELRNGCPNSQEETDGLSPVAELSNRCSEVIQVAREIAMSNSSFQSDDHAVSLADDKDDDAWVGTENPRPFLLYHPMEFQSSSGGDNEADPVQKDDTFDSLIAKVREKEPIGSDKAVIASQALFDDLCPIDLKFEASEMDFSSSELKFYKSLKKSFSEWQQGFSPYQDFCNRFAFRK